MMQVCGVARMQKCMNDLKDHNRSQASCLQLPLMRARGTYVATDDINCKQVQSFTIISTAVEFKVTL